MAWGWAETWSVVQSGLLLGSGQPSSWREAWHSQPSTADGGQRPGLRSAWLGSVLSSHWLHFLIPGGELAFMYVGKRVAAQWALQLSRPEWALSSLSNLELLAAGDFSLKTYFSLEGGY